VSAASSLESRNPTEAGEVRDAQSEEMWASRVMRIRRETICEPVGVEATFASTRLDINDFGQGVEEAA
jgi:hypothetical protein